ncbi:MAG: hypothetical protein RBJ76_15985 [Stenomitos frigidus ULC029]
MLALHRESSLAGSRWLQYIEDGVERLLVSSRVIKIRHGSLAATFCNGQQLALL